MKQLLATIWKKFYWGMVWLAGLCCLAGVCLYLWQRPLVLISVLAIIGLMAFISFKEKLRRKREGWWVDLLTHKEGADFTYHDESGNEIVFTCNYDLKAGVLFAHSPEEWQHTMPDWAKDRRDIILSRLKQKGQISIEEAHGEYRAMVSAKYHIRPRPWTN